MREVVLPEGLLEIGREAFSNCRLLESVRVPSTVTKLCHATLINCHSLRVVILLDGIHTIGGDAFYGCWSLEGIALPTTVTKIIVGSSRSCKLTLYGGIHLICRALEDWDLLDRVTVPSNALVVTQTKGDCYFSHVTEGVTLPTGTHHVVISSECFHSMPAAVKIWIQDPIAGIMARQMRMARGWDEKCCQLRELLVLHELQYKSEVAALLELGLWKAALSPDSTDSTREERQLMCGAGFVIPNVVAFLWLASPQDMYQSN